VLVDQAGDQDDEQVEIVGAQVAEGADLLPAVLEQFRERLRSLGVTSDEDVDLCTSVIGGLVNAQLANDPGGNRWGRLVDRTVDMLADNLGLPPETP
jgi:hypothetical protein